LSQAHALNRSRNSGIIISVPERADPGARPLLARIPTNTPSTPCPSLK
jgi:hypothetical protein